MPRGIKNKPEINICRVETWKLRELTPKQLERAQIRVGRLYEIPKRQQGYTKPRWLLSLFLSNLRQEKTVEDLSPRSIEAYRKRYGKDPVPTDRIRVGLQREIASIERRIWDMQQRRGCMIKPGELVARDAIRSETGISQETIDRLRGKRRPKIR